MAREVHLLLYRSDERARRIAAAHLAADALTGEEHDEFIATRVRKMQSAADEQAALAAPPPGVPAPSVHDDGGKYADLAEQFVLAHPEGVTTTQVAEGIGQEKASCTGTLRYVAKRPNRATIVRRYNKWYPEATYDAGFRGTTLREGIVGVLSAAAVPLGADDIYAELLKTLSVAKRVSFAAELSRMKAGGVVSVCGAGAQGALYSLAAGGAHAATVN